MTPTDAQAALLDQPSPLVPLDCDLRDFPYMPIFVDRLRKSRTWIRARYQPEVGFANMNLWLSSWHNLPAGSLEADDFVLADAAMCDMTRWREIRDEVMQGWVLCNDGRYYHPVVALCAIEAWKTRTRYRKTMAKARNEKAAKASQQTAFELADEPAPRPAEPVVEAPPPVVPEVEEPQISANSSIIGLKSEGRKEKLEKKKRGSLRSPHALRACGRVCDDPAFDEFMANYPNPQAPRFARMEWDAALARGATSGEILAGLAQHSFRVNPQFVVYPQRWLAGECWRTAGTLDPDSNEAVLRAVGLNPADFVNDPAALAMLQ